MARIDLNSPTANMFGIEPCPKCKSEFRWPMKVEDKTIIRCDDCRLEEPLEEKP